MPVIDSGHGGAAAHSERVSAVIACYLDEQAIPIMHERLTTVFTELGVDYEIVFVNDGSPDGSQAATGARGRASRCAAARPFGRGAGSSPRDRL